jgi:protein SCO1/2
VAAGIGLWLAASDPAPLPEPPPPPTLQRLGTVPDFSLTERSDRSVRLADLAGRVWAADFIYTTCTDTCPLQTARLATLQAEFAAEPEFRLVSISVDPSRDTPRVLRAYADHFQADRERWLFLTGSQGAVYALVRDGFKLQVEDVRKAMEGRPAPATPRKSGQGARMDCGMRNGECGMGNGVAAAGGLDRAVRLLFAPATAFAHSDHAESPLTHSSRFVLVDRQGTIRGYYPSDDDAALSRLRTDIRLLLRNTRL